MGDSYETIRSYDVPGLLLSQAVGGDLSMKSIRGALVNRESLTPDERKTLTDRLLGDDANPVIKTIGEIITNPWVLLMFATSPIGSRAIAAGLPFSYVRKEASAYQATHGGYLKHLMTDLDHVRGTGMENFVLAGESIKAKMAQEALTHSGLLEARQAFVKRLRTILKDRGYPDAQIDSAAPFDLSRYRKNDPVHELVEELQFLHDAKHRKLGAGGDVVTVMTGETHFRYVLPDEATGGSLVVEPYEAQQATQGRHLENIQQPRLRQAKEDIEKLFAYRKREWKKMSAEKRDEYAGSFNEFWARQGAEVTGAPDVNGVPGQFFMKIGSKQATKTPEILRGEMIDAGLAKFGKEYTDYLEASRKHMQYVFTRALGNEKHYAETGRFLFDDRKMENLIGSLDRDTDGVASAAGTIGDIDTGFRDVQGKELIYSILDQEGWKKVSGGNLGRQARAEAVRESLKKAINLDNWDNLYWRPRNSYKAANIEVNGVERPPPLGYNGLDSVIESAPWAASSSGKLGHRVAPLTASQDLWDIDQLRWYRKHGMLTDDGVEFAKDQKKRIQELYMPDPDSPEKGRYVMVHRPDLDGSVDRYSADMIHMAAVHTNPAPKHLVDLDETYLGHVDDSVKGKKTVVGRGFLVPRGESIKGYAGEATISDLADRVYTGLANVPFKQQVVRNMMGSMAGRMGPGHLAIADNLARSRATARWFADGFLGKVVESTGKPGKEWIAGLREYGALGSQLHARDFGDAVATYLYVSHLGLNVASALVNITQPLLLAAQTGRLDDVVGAWSDSMKEMLGYAKDRIGVRQVVTDNATKEALIRKNFKFADYQGENVIGIGPMKHEIMEGMGGAGESWWDKTTRFMMSPFEKTEWMNRNFTAHLMKRTYARHGRNYLTDPGFIEDARGLMLKTQFAQAEYNTPQVFKEGGMLGNRLLRMFAAFPLRQAMGALSTMPNMGGESYGTGLFKTVARGMGVSAVVYEVGKGLAGADLSRGLFAGGTFEALGGQGTDKSIVPSPPILSIPMDFIQSAAQEDLATFAGALARMVPSGVALSRLMGVMPNLRENWATALPGQLQKTYADWDNPLETGEVPVHKADGALMGYYKPALLLAKGLGIDAGKFAAKGELDYYLSKQVELNGKYKRQYLQALTTHEYAKAQKIADEYQERLKVPLTVSRAQVTAYLRSQTRSRGERILDRLPAAVRPAYATMVEQGGLAANLKAGAFQRGSTATQRDSDRSNAVTEADVRRIVGAHQAAQLGPGPKSDRAFEAYGK